METVTTGVVRALADDIRPALQMDDGNIELLDIVDGVVRVRLLGTYNGCPGAIMAVIMGIEQELRRHVPEIRYLEVIP